MPAQQRVRRDQPALAADTRKHTGDRGQQRPVAVIQPWRLRCALQHGELMAQHDDLEVLRTTGTDGEDYKRDEQTVKQTAHPPILAPRTRRSTATIG